MDPDEIKYIIDSHVPKYVNFVRYFMGITGYYRKFIEGFSKIENPITSLQKKGKKFFWDQECESNLNKLKELLTITPILSVRCRTIGGGVWLRRPLR